MAFAKPARAGSKLARMMGALRHRGGDGFAVALGEETFVFDGPEEVEALELASKTALGYNFFKGPGPPQPVRAGGLAYAVEGRMYAGKSALKLGELAGPAAGGPGKLKEFLSGVDGAYALCVADGETLLAARDPLGLKPLYYWLGGGSCALASERKALWRVGAGEVKRFPPGFIAIFKGGMASFKAFKRLTPPAGFEPTPRAEAARSVAELISASVEREAAGLRRAAVGFSGGLDSGLIAHLLKLSGVEVKLFAVGVEGKSNLGPIEEAAAELGLPLEERLFSTGEVEEAARRIPWLIEESNPMMVEVAIPIFWVLRMALEAGFSEAFLGQGADELFGGYERFVKVLKRDGEEACAKAIFQSVSRAHEINYERDEKVAAYNRVDLRLPYADWSLAEYAVKLPVGLKVSLSGGARVKKAVLRDAAKLLGLPESIAERRKRAVQYETGVHKAMLEISKRKGLSLREYVERSFKLAAESAGGGPPNVGYG